MFWITFLVSGFIVASVPWVANHFSNRIAGLLLLLPVMFTLSIIVQYLSNGEKATIEMMKASLIGFPTIIIFLGMGIYLFQKHASLQIVIFVSLAVWSVTATLVNSFLLK